VIALDYPALAARLVATRVEQGLPAHVEDPVALARIADTLKGSAQSEQRTKP
jgi:hypothetical protein